MREVLKQPEVGNYFGNWLVIDDAVYGSNRHPQVLCQCICGAIKPTDRRNLIRGLTNSCGCVPLANQTRHGMSKTPIYKVWTAMLQRCMNKRSKIYKDYGERGIDVCDRWLVFENFLEDMGDQPFKRATLERKDNNKGYSKENCVWATYKEQSRNTRQTNMITWNGKTQCLRDWGAELAETLGTSRDTISTRIHVYGWSIEKAFTTPVTKSGRHMLRSDKV